MITVTIKQEFHDKDRFSKVYPVGSVCDFEDGRAKELVSKGLAEMVSNDSTDVKPRRLRKGIEE